MLSTRISPLSVGDWDGNTPLHYASARGFFEAVQVIFVPSHRHPQTGQFLQYEFVPRVEVWPLERNFVPSGEL
jgi:hypothetical protein